MTPNGRELVNTNPLPYGTNKADLNLDLTDFRGFKGIEAVLDNPIGGAHSKVLAWYAGTVDQALERIDNEFVYERDGIEIQDRKGEVNVENWYDSELDPSARLWYSSSTIPDEYDPEEGIGTGWYYSYLNGGERKFDNPARSTVTTAFDNTSDPRSRGDFAVPTLFNGNFDASFSGNSESVTNNGVRNVWGGAIPGWSYHNGRPDQFDPDGAGDLKYGINIENLVDWKNISTLKDYRDRVGYSETQPNYALKMDGGGNGRGDSIVHNSFVVPDWGALRFDLHAPIPAKIDELDQYLKVYIETDTATPQELKAQFIPPETIPNGDRINTNLPAVDLREVHPGAFSTPDLGTAVGETLIQSQLNRIGFGSKGFETFQVDIPDDLRGKSARLRFELYGNKTIYLDNIFIQSKHLQLGNPILNGQESRRDLTQPQNYLVEAPQFSASYNESLKTPNWVSYELDKSWTLGSKGKIIRKNVDPDPFAEDFSLPSPPLTRVPGKLDTNYDVFQFGHMTAAEDRARLIDSYYENDATGNEYEIYKDYNLSYLMTNIVPQNIATGEDPWSRLESYLTEKLVNKHNKKLFIIAGRDGERKTFDSQVPAVGDISAPSNVWKVVVVLEAGQSIQDIDENTIAFAVDIPNFSSAETKRGVPGAPEVSLNKDWKFYVASINDLEEATNYDFLSNIPQNIQEAIENNSDVSELPDIINASLLASSELNTDLLNSFKSRSSINTSIRHSQIPDQGIIYSEGVSIDRSPQTGISQDSSFEISVEQIGSQVSPHQISLLQIGSGQVHVEPFHMGQASKPETSIAQINLGQTTPYHLSSTQVSTPQIGVIDANVGQNSSSQIDLSQIGILDGFATSMTQLNSSEITFSSSIPSEQFFSIHNSTPKITNVLNNSATNIWSDLLQPQTQLDIDFLITDLPTGQLAEATITGFDDSGVPNTGTILIDHDANGVGWFIDRTPLDNSEFTAQDTDSYLLAATESEASGKYDLLTTVLHELAHLYGFIDGYEGFDANVETENGTTKFIGDDFEAILDGEHLDKQAHPYDLLNTHLAPGMRKLPSELDVQILQALIATELDRNGNNPAGEELLAFLTSDPLLAIANGDFSISDTTTDSFAWDTRGASGIEDGQAVLTEDSPFLSNFTQTFTVPEEAKTIQFKLIGAELGASELSPPDAFEVALLDADTNESLTAVSDLINTDSLLNIQNDGTTYFSDKVRIGGATSGEIIGLDRPRTVTVDISDLTPGTEATLYFDLLGFGDADSRVVIDSVASQTNSYCHQ